MAVPSAVRVAGIGASAGGFDAFLELVSAPPDHDRCRIVFHSIPEPGNPKTESAAKRTQIDSLRQALAAAIDDRELW